MLTISNQPNFTGRARFVGECTQIPKAKVLQILQDEQLSKKTYDVFISNESIVAKKDAFDPVAPNVTTMINPKKDSIEYAIKFTMETFDNIIKHNKLT